MSGGTYGFYGATLRFVAGKLAAGKPANDGPTSDGSAIGDGRAAVLAAHLEAAAAALDETGAFTVAAADLETAARAFAGVAGFLQKEILPEAVALGHGAAERQLRWTVDAAMEAVNALLRAAAAPDRQPLTVTPPPEVEAPRS